MTNIKRQYFLPIFFIKELTFLDLATTNSFSVFAEVSGTSGSTAIATGAGVGDVR